MRRESSTGNGAGGNSAPSRSSAVTRWERLASSVTLFAGSNWGFGCAGLLVLIWLASGPLVGYSEMWQLAINTSTTIVTFLMVFLIQRSQNKESKAVQLKLNEIVAALEGASNRMISVEDLGEKELDALAQQFRSLLMTAKQSPTMTESLSIEGATGPAEAATARKG
jgi:low affinity Fe/Cu permease